MAIVAHGLITLVYLALAAAAGISLSGAGVGVDSSLAATGGVALAGAILHQAVARARRDRVFGETLRSMSASHAELAKVLADSRAEVRRLTGTFEEAARRAPRRGWGEVVSEMRVLQTLLEQIAPGERSNGGAARRAPAGPKAPGAIRDIDGQSALEVVRDALENDRVDIYLQPVVSLPQRKTAFYETFTRLRSIDGALIEPAKYLAVAERAGLVSAIDNNMLFRGVQLVRKSQRRNLKLGFFCNVSPYTLSDASFFPEFIEFMEGNAGLAANLIFEFAQSDLARHDDRATKGLGRLNDMGFRFSVDRVETLDFDFEVLAERHVSFVKIEAGLLLEHLGNPDTALHLHRMMRTLDRAGILLIAEKIEAEQQVVELLDFPIDLGQGYLFGTPRLSRVDD